jgi:phosphate transport system permease protein
LTKSPPPPQEIATGTTGPGRSPFTGVSGRRRARERVIKAFLFACGGLSIAITIGILGTLAFETIEFLREVPIIDFVFGTRWSPLIQPYSYGVLPLVGGTLMVGIISGLVGVPLGVGTAIYLSEYATPRVRRRVKPVLEILAGMPTVVLGYFALTFVTPVVVRKILPGTDFYNGLSASLVIGVMIVPIIASVSEDAMSAVPRALREGAYGLGASRMTVSTRVVVPAALSGIMASVILGISRAVGETMIVAIAAGSTPRLTADPRESIQTLTGYIAQVAFGDVPQGSLKFKGIFAVGAVLFFMTLGLNMISQRLVRRFRQVY